jgi:hypothetical protein
MAVAEAASTSMSLLRLLTTMLPLKLLQRLAIGVDGICMWFVALLSQKLKVTMQRPAADSE